MQTLWRWWKDGESGDVGTRGRCHRDISLGQTDADKASGGATDFLGQVIQSVRWLLQKQV